MAGFLGAPEVMAFYPAPKSREDAQRWIDWKRRNYADRGHGLWVVESPDGEFLGDCGLAWQPVNGAPMLDPAAGQGQGYATEAAACRDCARTHLGARELVAIIHPENTAPRRVAEKMGMRHVTDDHGQVRTVLGMDL